MRYSAAFFPVLLLASFLTSGVSHGQKTDPARNAQDFTYNTFYESLVIPLFPDVVIELRMNDSQKVAAKKLDSPLPNNIAGDRYWLERKKRKAELLKLLTEDQRRRLEELTYQYQGALASFNLPQVATTLAITPEQKQRLASVQFLLRSGSENLTGYEKLLRGGSGRGKFLVQLRLSCDCVAESILVPAQMFKWRSMQGKPLSPRPASWD